MALIPPLYVCREEVVLFWEYTNCRAEGSERKTARYEYDAAPWVADNRSSYTQVSQARVCVQLHR